jgi:hypothetical protein
MRAHFAPQEWSNTNGQGEADAHALTSTRRFAERALTTYGTTQSFEPPSTRSVSPVIQRASSEARNTRRH